MSDEIIQFNIMISCYCLMNLPLQEKKVKSRIPAYVNDHHLCLKHCIVLLSNFIVACKLGSSVHMLMWAKEDMSDLFCLPYISFQSGSSAQWIVLSR